MAESNAFAQLLREAIGLHQQGKLAPAARLYGQILDQDPANFDALHFLGLLHVQNGLPERGVESISKALAVQPDSVEALSNLGAAYRNLKRNDDALRYLDRAVELAPDYPDLFVNRGIVLQALDRHADALASFEQALALEPDYAEALFNQGNALRALGRHAEALASYERAVAAEPDYPEALSNRGTVLGALNRHEEAVESFDRALAIRPQFPGALVGRGVALHELARHADALASFERALTLDSDHVDALNSHGIALQALDRHADALASFERALALRPNHVDALNNRAAALLDAEYHEEALARKCYEEALASCEQALALRPDFVDALNNRGVALQALQRYDEALASHERALGMKPDHPETLNYCGAALVALDRYEEGLAAYDRALALRPDFAEALYNRGAGCQAFNRHAQAIVAFEHVLALKPGHAEAHVNIAFAHLCLGNLAAGWPHYEWRIAVFHGKPHQADPRSPQRMPARPSTLLPFNFQGKRILLLPEQGLGDELFFLRFAGRARARGAWLAYLASPQIAAMIERSGAVDRTVSRSEEAGSIDEIVLVGDLPLLLGENDGELPPGSLRLTPLPERVDQARARLRALGPGPYLALTWRAGAIPPSIKSRRRYLYKETALEALAVTVAGWPGQFIAIQRQPRAGEIERLSGLLGRPVHDWRELNEDLEAMLGVLALVDDYVAVSNTNVHLMAGLGRGGRVVTPNPPEWRWSWTGEVSPWFPGFRVYRQAPGQAMTEALSRLAAELRTT